MKNRKAGLSRKAVRNICLLLIVLSIGGYITLGIFYNGDQGDKDDVKEQIAQKEPQMQILEDARANKDLSELLEEAEAELEAVEARIPEGKDSTDVTETLMELADSTGVDIFPVAGRVKPATTETIQGNQYYVVSFSLTPKGSYDQLMEFIELMESGSETENISIEYTTINDSGDSWTASISGKFYSRMAEKD